MPLRKSVADVKDDQVQNLPLRRSNRLNSNVSTSSKILTTRSGTKENGNISCKEEFSQTEEMESSVIDDTINSADVQGQTLTTACNQDSLSNKLKTVAKHNPVSGNNEVSDEFDIKRITRSQANSKAKLITKECFVVLEETSQIHATRGEPKMNSEESDNLNSDKSIEVHTEKQVDVQVSGVKQCDDHSFSKTPHEKQQLRVNKTIEESSLALSNLDLNTKFPLSVASDLESTALETEDKYPGREAKTLEASTANTFLKDNNILKDNENEKKYGVTFFHFRCNDEKMHPQKNEDLNISTNKMEGSEGKKKHNMENVRENIETTTCLSDLTDHKQMLTDSINGINAETSVIENEVLNNGADSSVNSSIEKMKVHSASSEENDIDLKIDDLLSKRFSTSDNEEVNEHNPFIDSMAEEGEEDTPSEGSNDIIEVGEDINTTESEFSTDESYETNSFIDDEDEHQLLSGEEYDLSFDKPKKKSRIIQLSSGSDDDVVRISKPKKELQKKRRKSRIIKFSDSSNEDTNVENKENELCSSNLRENPSRCNDEVNKTEANQVTVIEKQKVIEDNMKITDVSNKHIGENAVLLCDVNASQQCDFVNNGENEETFVQIQHDEMNDLSVSWAIVNVSIIKKTETKTSAFTGNIKVKNTYSNRLSDRINEVIDSLCFDIKNVNAVAISLSIDNSDATQHFENKTNESIPVEVVRDSIHKSKLSQDKSKKGRGKKRKVSKKKKIPENAGKYKEIGELKTKKMKRNDGNKITRNSSINLNKNRSIKQPHLLPNCTPANVLINNKKFKHNQMEQMATVSSKIGKQLQESNISAKKRDIKEKRSTVAVFKNGNQESSEKTRAPIFEPIHVKRKRRIKGRYQKTIGDAATQMNILDEALFDIQNKKESSVNQVYKQWDVKSIFVDPSSVSGGQPSRVEHETIKCNKSENLKIWNKFAAKDFKNSMFYDPSRVKRIDTKQMIKKRGANT